MSNSNVQCPLTHLTKVTEKCVPADWAIRITSDSTHQNPSCTYSSVLVLQIPIFFWFCFVSSKLISPTFCREVSLSLESVFSFFFEARTLLRTHSNMDLPPTLRILCSTSVMEFHRPPNGFCPKFFCM